MTEREGANRGGVTTASNMLESSNPGFYMEQSPKPTS